MLSTTGLGSPGGLKKGHCSWLEKEIAQFMGWILQGGHRSIIKASVNFQVSPVSKTNVGEGDARSGIPGVLLSSATTPAHQRNQLFICSKDSIWDLCSAPSLWQGPGAGSQRAGGGRFHRRPPPQHSGRDRHHPYHVSEEPLAEL